MICHRCHSDAVVGTIAQMPLCWTCIRQVKAKQGVSFVGLDAEGDVQAGETMGSHNVEAGNLSAKTSERLGNTADKMSSAADKATGAVKDITSTIKVLAITGACFGGAFLIYTMWRAHKAQEQAVSFATSHPELLKMALV